jgi:hypothetical protein
VLYGLRSQIVEQVGMVIVGDVIEIHEARYHIIFQPCLFDTSSPECEHFTFVGPQRLNPQFL